MPMGINSHNSGEGQLNTGRSSTTTWQNIKLKTGVMAAAVAALFVANDKAAAQTQLAMNTSGRSVATSTNTGANAKSETEFEVSERALKEVQEYRESQAELRNALLEQFKQLPYMQEYIKANKAKVDAILADDLVYDPFVVIRQEYFEWLAKEITNMPDSSTKTTAQRLLRVLPTATEVELDAEFDKYPQYESTFTFEKIGGQEVVVVVTRAPNGALINGKLNHFDSDRWPEFRVERMKEREGRRTHMSYPVVSSMRRDIFSASLANKE